MTGAMYAAVSGLRTHMDALNVIGNNISNVNTYGYKAARYTFNEALYTTKRYGSNGTDIVGGHNPSQIGYGCSIGTIDLDMSTKNYTPTGVGLDCMINGDGFFMCGDKDSVITEQSQLQAVGLSRLGNLEFHDGYLVDGNGNVILGYAAVEGDDGEIQANDYITAIRFPKVDDNGNILYPVDNDGSLEYEDDDEYDMPVIDSISIDEASGRISGTVGDQIVVIGYIAIAKVDNPNGVTHVDGRYYQALDGAGNVHATSIGGLEKFGEDYDPANEELGFAIEDANETDLITGGLESSGTDLATEISNMIIIQRGYQANTRIVTVTDSMLEELVNMKR